MGRTKDNSGPERSRREPPTAGSLRHGTLASGLARAALCFLRKFRTKIHQEDGCLNYKLQTNTAP